MADFFGGILDDLRGSVTDINSFFNNTLGTDVARGISGGSTGGPAQGQKNYQKLAEANFLARMDNVNQDHNAASPGYAPTRNLDKSNEGKSVNFENTEQSWLMRMRRFSQVDSEINAGKVNEGPDR